MSVFVRLNNRGHKKHRKPTRMSQDELRLHDSLLNRPKDIKTEYSQSVVKYGKRFERGDDKAYTSLAHTLFVLNTGLINLINNALTSDKLDKSQSRQSLLLLSESAAISTIQALNQLDFRLSSPEELSSDTRRARREQRPTKQFSESATLPRPPPSPLLARGGWVRSKSGSSIVTVASAKKTAVRAAERSRSTSPPVQTVRTIQSKPSKPHEQDTRPSTNGLKIQSYSHHSPDDLPVQKLILPRSWSEPPEYEQRAPSMLLVPGDYFDDHLAPQAPISPPPKPPKTPLHTRDDVRTRPRPISAATFMTASTKIGEIPEHRWVERSIPEEEIQRLPLPYVIPAPLESPKRKSKGMRFWKRSEREAAISL